MSQELKLWHVGAQNDGLFIIDEEPRPSTDDITKGSVTLQVIAKIYDHPDAAARASLIAAAPQMAEMLRAACNALRSFQYGNSSEDFAKSMADSCVHS